MDDRPSVFTAEEREAIAHIWRDPEATHQELSRIRREFERRELFDRFLCEAIGQAELFPVGEEA